MWPTLLCIALSLVNVYGIAMHGEMWPVSLIAFGICTFCAGFCYRIRHSK